MVLTCNAGFDTCNGDQADGCEANLNTDASHCSSCATNCGSTVAHATGVSCSSGSCTYTGACTAPWLDCSGGKADGCETDGSGDKTNCGSCGNTCENLPQVATASCNSGSCSILTCDAGYLDCGAGSGCETNKTNDPNNCGGCGVVCSSQNMQTRTCGSGTCDGTCATGFADCANGKQVDGCEVNTVTDPNNCGACGKKCADLPQVATATCASSACVISTCDPNFADCTGGVADGCETNTSTSASHCGGCNMPCSSNHIASPSCSGGSCNGACDSGFADCDGNKRTNGCEADLNNSVTTCGGCGNNCNNLVVNVVGTVGCATGACTYTGSCAAGWGDCDGNKANGCETNLNTTPAHCNACNNACTAPSGGTPTCTGGLCDFTCAPKKRCGDVCADCCKDSDCPIDAGDKCQDPSCTDAGTATAKCGFTLKGCVQQECHNTPTCNPSTGECQSSPLTGGTCGATGCCTTGTGTCDNGTCACASMKDCTIGVPACQSGLCATDGNCTTENIANGTACTPADKCLLDTTCSAGDCIGTPKTCTPSGQCRIASCNSSSGDCEETNASPGTACTSGNPCSQNEVCNAVGECVGSLLSDGTPCSLADCTAAATCQSGACTCPSAPDAGTGADLSVAVDMTGGGNPTTDGGGTNTSPDMQKGKGGDKSGCQAAPGDASSLFSLLLLLSATLRHRRR